MSALKQGVDREAGGIRSPRRSTTGTYGGEFAMELVDEQSA